MLRGFFLKLLLGVTSNDFALLILVAGYFAGEVPTTRKGTVTGVADGPLSMAVGVGAPEPPQTGSLVGENSDTIPWVTPVGTRNRSPVIWVSAHVV